jgi:colanic acid/amylovoran biosynthesis glycosyltransferase
MKIVEVSYTWPAETFIQRHVLVLREAGLDVCLIARQGTTLQSSSASIGEARRDIPARVMPNFDHLDLAGKVWSLRHLLTRPERAVGTRPLRDRVLLAFFERLKPDLIHFHTASLAVAMSWIPKELGIPHTVSVRGSDVQVFPLRSDGQAEATAQTLRGASGIHVVCKALGERAERLCGVPLERKAIYTAVSVPTSLPPYQPPATELHLLSVGRIHWRKAFPDLLLALKAMHEWGYPARLTLVGSGEDSSRIAHWVRKLDLSEHLELPGKLPLDQFRDLFSQASAFVQSSVAEGFSNAVAEAMAWGCPVFATDVGGSAEIIQDGENGFLLPALQPETWPERLRLAQDRTLMERVRQAAYETARRLFDPRRHAEDFLTFYEQAIRRGPIPSISAPARPAHADSAPADTSSAGLRLLVRGAWHWENGTDLILRALAPLCREGRLQMVLWGGGPQEDELRYLVDFLRLDGRVQLIESTPGPEGSASEWGQRATITLDISEAQSRGWQLTRNGVSVACLPFGEIQALRGILEEVLGE